MSRARELSAAAASAHANMQRLTDARDEARELEEAAHRAWNVCANVDEPATRAAWKACTEERQRLNEALAEAARRAVQIVARIDAHQNNVQDALSN